MKKEFVLCLSALLCYCNLFGQVNFSSEGFSSLDWPFTNSFYINHRDGSNGWKLIEGSRFHVGSDLYAQDWLIQNCIDPEITCGQKLLAPFDGVVLATNGSEVGFGNQIIIHSKTNKNFAMRFAHLETFTVKAGDIIKSGDPIGTIGDTGNGGCHLHMALYKNLLSTPPGNENQTYLDIMLMDPTRFTVGEYVSAEFTLNANIDQALSYHVFSESNIFFDDNNQNTISGSLSNNSNTQDLKLDLFLNLKKIQNENIVSESEEKQEITLNKLSNLNFSFNDIFNEEGTYDLSILYNISNEHLGTTISSNCTKDTIFKKRITVYSREKCFNMHEPNDDKTSAFNLDFTNSITLESYLSSHQNNTKDVDFFNFSPSADGILTYSTEIDVRDLQVTISTTNSEYDLNDLAGGLKVFKNRSYYMKVSSDKNDLCVPYSFTLTLSPSSNEILVFPNPNSGHFKIGVNSFNEAYNTVIYDLKGVQVYKNENILSNDSGNIEFFIDKSLTKNIYLLYLTKNKDKFTRVFKLLIK